VDARSPAATEPPSVLLMNVRHLLIPLLCVGAIALACGPRAHSQASLVSLNLAKRTTPPSQQAKKAARKKESSVTRITPSFAVQVDGGTLRFALDVTNVGKKNVELNFPDGQTHDFAVLDSAGREVYRWSASRMFTQSLQNRTIEDGETLRISEEAAPSLPHGSYVAVATLRSSNFPVQERVTFELP
jgi:hypothetical protein